MSINKFHTFVIPEGKWCQEDSNNILNY